MQANKVIQIARRLLSDDIGPHHWDTEDLLALVRDGLVALRKRNPRAYYAGAGITRAVPPLASADEDIVVDVKWNRPLACYVAAQALMEDGERADAELIEAWKQAFEEAARG